MCASPILVCPIRHDPRPSVRQITNAGGGILVQAKIKERRTRREVKRKPRRGATMAGLLRRSLRWKPQLAEKTRSRDHNACDPRGQAGEQHKVAQEKRHATASPLPPRCRAILTVQDIPFVGYPTHHDEMFRVPRRGSDSWRGTESMTQKRHGRLQVACRPVPSSRPHSLSGKNTS